MKTINTPLILSAVQSDIFSNTVVDSSTCEKILKNLKQFIQIIKKNKNLPIYLVLDGDKNFSFQKLLAKYLIFSKKNIKIIPMREARSCKEQVIFLFIYHKKVKDSNVVSASQNSCSFPFLFNQTKNNFLLFKVLGNFNNYKHYLFLISLLESI